MEKQFVLLPIAIVCLTALVSSEPIQFTPCHDSHASTNCTVNSVNISPCAEAPTGQACRIKKGKTAGIKFDFTPEIASDYLESRAYWVASAGTLPFIGMVTDACQFTTCPSIVGKEQTYNYTLKISKMYSAREYNIQWRLWDEDENMMCCFGAKIRLY